MIPQDIQRVIDEVEAFQKTREDSWNIPREEGMILHNIALAAGCRYFVEVGTSYGFSGLFLGAAARANGGKVHTFDRDPKKHEAAREHFSQAGLAETIHLHSGDALELLDGLEPGVDFAFLDATKTETVDYWRIIEPKLAPSCVITVDNISTHEEQLGAFAKMLRTHEDFTSCPVHVGNGFELAVRKS
jgi:predicted O-methyltransferase YrrM